MVLAILLIFIIGLICLFIIGATFIFAWSATIILAILAIFFHKKYRKWQSAVPSDTQTQETIDIRTKRYKTGRTVAAILLVISLILSVRFTYWVAKQASTPPDSTNSESVSVDSGADIVELA